MPNVIYLVIEVQNFSPELSMSWSIFQLQASQICITGSVKCYTVPEEVNVLVSHPYIKDLMQVNITLGTLTISSNLHLGW